MPPPGRAFGLARRRSTSLVGGASLVSIHCRPFSLLTSSEVGSQAIHLRPSLVALGNRGVSLRVPLQRFDVGRKLMRDLAHALHPNLIRGPLRFRACLRSPCPEDRGDEVDDGREAFVRLLVARGNASKGFYAAEGVFDEMPPLVFFWVVLGIPRGAE
jgi:hypothetical protein